MPEVISWFEYVGPCFSGDGGAIGAGKEVWWVCVWEVFTEQVHRDEMRHSVYCKERWV